ncbi:MAG TPA: DUF4276 family protein [bacterium]|jgi:hypothetical protein
MDVHIGCVVEGHGDREAVPVLIRRIVQKFDPTLSVHIPAPIRIPKNRLVKSGELERAVELTARKTGDNGAVLVILDSDDDCPAQIGPELLKRAIAARSNIKIAVVLAKREFESWFLASADSLRGFRGLMKKNESPIDPEAIRGAKEWLSNQMETGRSYVETLDQPAFAARFDLEVARRADSFDKFYREIVRLLKVLCESKRNK